MLHEAHGLGANSNMTVNVPLKKALHRPEDKEAEALVHPSDARKEVLKDNPMLGAV